MSTVDQQIMERIRSVTGYPVYAGILPQGGSFPAVILERISFAVEGTFTYRNSTAEESTFSAHLWTESSSSRLSAWVTLRSALDRWNEAGVHDTFIEGVFDNFEPETELFQRTVDFRVIHDEDT